MKPSSTVSLVLLVLAALSAVPPAAAQRGPAALRSGPMVGYGTHREVMLWVQATAETDVQFRYWPESAPDSAQLTPVVRATAAEDHTARVAVTGLPPGRRFRYELLLGGRVVPRPYELRFQTQPLWQWRTDPPTFTVAVGSCNYVNDPAFDRPGRPYGSDHQIFTHLAAARPDVMLWLGDNTYLREVDWWTPSGISYRYAHTRALPELQPLLGAAHHYAIWDDHDYGPNNADRSWVLKDASLTVFQRYWANLSYGLPGLPGVFGQFEWGDVHFFVLDDRYYKTPEDTPVGDEETNVGHGQLEWLLDALTASSAPFKVVAVGGQVLNPTGGDETWASFPAERERLLREIVRRRIPGVLFVSGDRHFTELRRVDPEGGYPLYDFTTSPLTAGPTSAEYVAREDSTGRVPGTVVTGTHNFGLMTFSGPRTDRTLTLRTVDASGQERWSYTVRARDLRFE